MGTKSRETIYGASIREAAERAAEASKEADRLAVGLLFWLSHFRHRDKRCWRGSGSG